MQPTVPPTQLPPLALLTDKQREHWLARSLAVATPANSLAYWANRLLWLGLAIFCLALPHSIAATHIGLNLSLLAWVIRDLSLRRLHFRRTPLDIPLLAFIGLTILSALFSVEPAVSLPKLKTLLLWGVIYLITTNLRACGLRPLLALLLTSAALGALFSVAERAYGRGVVIIALAPESPLLRDQPLGTHLQPGDAIWMIARQRIYSLAGIAQALRAQPLGSTAKIEALHAGDPVPTEVNITPELKQAENPLGLTVAGRTRRFRASGFGRQFLTFAEQMQMFALLCFGVFLTALGTLRATSMRWWSGGLALLFLLALLLTASRAVMAAFLIAALIVALRKGGRRAVMAALPLAFLLGALSVYVITTARNAEATSFSDDSAKRRLGYMRAGLRVIPQHPLFGVGLDAHTRHWREWGFPGDYVTHMHSTPIQLALDRGLPALGCYAWLVWLMLRLVWRSYRRQLQAQRTVSAGFLLGAFGALCGVTLSSLVNYNFGDAEVLLLALSLVSVAWLFEQEAISASPILSAGTPPEAQSASA